MKDRRQATRYVLKAPAEIRFDGISRACTIFDKSKTGARLTNLDNLKLPPTFVVQMGNEKQPCWLIWQDDKEAGVSFTDPNG